MTGASKIPCLYKGLSALKNLKTHTMFQKSSAPDSNPSFISFDLCQKSLILQKSSVLHKGFLQRGLGCSDAIHGETGNPFEHGLGCALIGNVQRIRVLADYAHARPSVRRQCR